MITRIKNNNYVAQYDYHKHNEISKSYINDAFFGSYSCLFPYFFSCHLRGENCILLASPNLKEKKLVILRQRTSKICVNTR